MSERYAINEVTPPQERDHTSLPDNTEVTQTSSPPASNQQPENQRAGVAPGALHQAIWRLQGKKPGNGSPASESSTQIDSQSPFEDKTITPTSESRTRAIAFAQQSPPKGSQTPNNGTYPSTSASKNNSTLNLPKMKRTDTNVSTETSASKKSKKRPFSGMSNIDMAKPAHAMSWDEIVTKMNANVKDGLTAAEAEERHNLHGANELGDDEGVKLWKIILNQFGNMMTLVLLAAMGVSFGIQSYIEGGVIAAVIILNVIIGSWQEYSAQKTMDGLRNLSSPTANVVRDGSNKTVATREVVPGDMVELKMGDTVPADIRMVEAVNFETDEAMLTGESMPAKKDADVVLAEDTGPGDRANVAFSTSTVTKGRARGIVYAIALETGIGSIAENLRQKDRKRRQVKRKSDGTALPHHYIEAAAGTGWDVLLMFLGVTVGTPLQRKLSWLAIVLFIVAIIFAIVVLAANSFSGDREVVIYAVATGLSMIPASLVAILIITMGNGTRAMSKRHVIVRNTKSLESLGSVTDICSDKTGTITQGKMIVARAWLPSPNGGTIVVDESGHPFNPTNATLRSISSKPSDIDEDKLEVLKPEVEYDQVQLRHFLNVASLANLAHVHRGKEEDEWVARGDPTEIAIQVFASRFDWNRERWTDEDNPTWKQIAEFPFDSKVKRMTVIFENTEDNEKWILTKGAVERIIDRCKYIHIDSEKDATEMTKEHGEDILKQMNTLASLGLRTLALASRLVADDETTFSDDQRDSIENGLVFRGIVGIYDPPRAESAPSVKLCHDAGIVVHMLTGDHPGTATAIAKEVGILPRDMSRYSKETSDAMVMTAPQFDALSEAEIDALPALPLVIARCAPDTKVRMIEALHRRSKFAAMTGDGVNDAPSLNRADVGIAMGQAGSDVAKDASDIILSDDNFASILNAVEEGRRMFSNIQKFVLHLLAQNVSQALILLIGLAFKDSTGFSVFPISPVEIMWIIMVTSSIPDMGLGFEQASPNIMKEKPRSLKKGIFTTEVILDILVYGLWIAALCLGAFTIVLHGFGDGSLGEGCNNSYSEACDGVFRARATAFSCLTWFSVFLAWELVNIRESLFRLRGRKNEKWFGQVLWNNKVLFFSVVFGLLSLFAVLYIPVISDKAFKHKGITWEWAVVIIATLLFFAGVETWKFGKRVFYRRKDALKNGDEEKSSEQSAFAEFQDEKYSSSRDRL